MVSPPARQAGADIDVPYLRSSQYKEGGASQAYRSTTGNAGAARGVTQRSAESEYSLAETANT